jgi:hypothetical protein
MVGRPCKAGIIVCSSRGHFVWVYSPAEETPSQAISSSSMTDQCCAFLGQRRMLHVAICTSTNKQITIDRHYRCRNWSPEAPAAGRHWHTIMLRTQRPGESVRNKYNIEYSVMIAHRLQTCPPQPTRKLGLSWLFYSAHTHVRTSQATRQFKKHSGERPTTDTKGRELE